MRTRTVIVLTLALALPAWLAACRTAPPAHDAPPGPGGALPAPEALLAEEGDGRVTLSWDVATDERVTGYRVLQAEIDGEFEAVGTTGVEEPSWTADGLSNGTPYRFAVVATGEGGAASEPSEPVLAAPFSLDAPSLERIEAGPGGPTAVLEDGRRFALLTAEELRSAEDLEMPGFEPLRPSAGALPARYTLSAYQTPIRNQGGRGTCQTFAAVAAMEAMYARLGFGRLDLSEQYASHITRMVRLDRTPPADATAHENTLGVRGGGNSAAVLRRLQTYRIPLESAAPYVASGDYANTDQAGDAPRIDPADDAVAQRVYNDFNLQDEETVYRIPSALTHTPFPRAAQRSARYGVTGYASAGGRLDDPSWYEETIHGGNEIAFAFCFNGGGSDENGVWRPGDDTDSCGGHQVLLIGYDRTDPEDPYFIAKNSWGETAYRKMSYDFVTDPDARMQAVVVTGVTDPGRDAFHPQLALGRWDLVYDGEAGTLDISRLSGFYAASELAGSEDRRLGAFFDDAGRAHRVNGAVEALGANGEISFRVDFADPALDYGTLRGADFTGYIGRRDPLFMAGTYTLPGSARTYGFYAHKDGPLASAPGGGTLAADAFPGVWRVHGLEGGSWLVIEDVLSTGSFTGLTTHDRADVAGTIDLSTGRVAFDLRDGSGIEAPFEGYAHDGDLGTISGVYARGEPSGLALIRASGLPRVAIDTLGELREDGLVELGATTADFVDAGDVAIDWSYTIGSGGSEVPFASSAPGEVFEATLPCDDLLLYAVARDASRGLEARDVAPLSCVPKTDVAGFHMTRAASATVSTDGVVALASDADELLVGDDAGDAGHRSLMHFPFKLPEDVAGIASAEITLHLGDVTGTPYGTLGDLRAYHADYGATIEAGDYYATPLPGAAVLPFDGSSTSGSMSFDVTAAMRDAWENRATRGDRLQLVLYFGTASDADGRTDRARFLAEDRPGTTLLPMLTITYENY